MSDFYPNANKVERFFVDICWTFHYDIQLEVTYLLLQNWQKEETTIFRIMPK